MESARTDGEQLALEYIKLVTDPQDRREFAAGVHVMRTTGQFDEGLQKLNAEAAANDNDIKEMVNYICTWMEQLYTPVYKACIEAQDRKKTRTEARTIVKGRILGDAAAERAEIKSAKKQAKRLAKAGALDA